MLIQDYSDQPRGPRDPYDQERGTVLLEKGSEQLRCGYAGVARFIEVRGKGYE